MNTPTDWKTKAKISNPERKVFWESVFGGDEVPIVCFLPELARLPGFKEPQQVYLLDLKAITEEQKERLVAALAEKFGDPADVVAKEIDYRGLPILAADVSVSSSDQGLVMSLM